MKRYIQAGFVSGILLACGAALAADQLVDTELNHPIGSAQKIDPPSGNAMIAGAIGNGTGAVTVNDTDYYTFYGMAGDVVTFDIDGGMGGTRSVDTVLAVFGTGAGFPMLRQNDDARPLDEGSVSTYDARIDAFRLPASGYYVVGVSNAPRYFITGGNVTNGTNVKNGDYKLIITGLTPPVQQINIEIKPGNDGLAPINPKSNGKVPVALLSSSEFVATSVDTASLTFGAEGDESSFSHCAGEGQDVNGDGHADLVCHFENQKAGFQKGDLEGIVRGKMKFGTRFEGRGLLKVVPEKRAL